MTTALRFKRSVDCLLNGGVIAYPTEGVFGLGCLPEDEDAVMRILDIKRRPYSAGLILIAPDYALLDDWIAPTAAERERLAGRSATPVTWVVTADPQTPDWITGGRATVAVRLSEHPVVTALCRATQSALVSTSANHHGRPPARSTLAARKILGREVDCVVPGGLGGAAGPSEIRMAQDNRVVRAATAP